MLRDPNGQFCALAPHRDDGQPSQAISRTLSTSERTPTGILSLITTLTDRDKFVVPRYESAQSQLWWRGSKAETHDGKLSSLLGLSKIYGKKHQSFIMLVSLYTARWKLSIKAWGAGRTVLRLGVLVVRGMKMTVIAVRGQIWCAPGQLQRDKGRG